MRPPKRSIHFDSQSEIVDSPGLVSRRIYCSCAQHCRRRANAGGGDAHE